MIKPTPADLPKGITLKFIQHGLGTRACYFVDMEQVEGRSYHLDLLKRPGDMMSVIFHHLDKDKHLPLRASVHDWCKRYRLKIKFRTLLPYQFELELVEGAFVVRKARGTPVIRFPEFALMEVGDAYDYPMLDKPKNKSYLPEGIENAMRREKKKRGFEFEMSPVHAAYVRILRVR